MLAMVFVTSSAWALNETQVYRGGTYVYNLNGIQVVGTAAANLTINYQGDASEVVTIISGFNVSASPFTAPVGSYAGRFSVEFSSTATIGSDTLVVRITDSGTNGCSNFINFIIEVLPDPTIDLTIVADEDQYCQTTALHPSHNTPASQGQTNEISFTVTPAITGVGSNDYTYDYVINIPIDGETSLGSYLISYSGPGTFTESTHTVEGASTTGNGVFTITFATTTGIDVQTISGSISGVELTMTASNAEYTETGSGDNDDVVTVNRTPSIGTFGN